MVRKVKYLIYYLENQRIFEVSDLITLSTLSFQPGARFKPHGSDVLRASMSNFKATPIVLTAYLISTIDKCAGYFNFMTVYMHYHFDGNDRGDFGGSCAVKLLH